MRLKIETGIKLETEKKINQTSDNNTSGTILNIVTNPFIGVATEPCNFIVKYKGNYYNLMSLTVPKDTKMKEGCPGILGHRIELVDDYYLSNYGCNQWPIHKNYIYVMTDFEADSKNCPEIPINLQGHIIDEDPILELYVCLSRDEETYRQRGNGLYTKEELIDFLERDKQGYSCHRLV